jgi:hypothetical protein
VPWPVSVFVVVVIAAVAWLFARRRPMGVPTRPVTYSHIDESTGQTIVDVPGSVVNEGTQHTSGPGPSDQDRQAKLHPTPAAPADPKKDEQSP